MPSIIGYAVCRRLFHELGHALHHLLSETKTAALFGTSVGREHAEAVSIMFEKFLWLPAHMSDCSLHYSYLDPAYLSAWKEANPGKPQPAKKLPDKMMEKLIEARDVGAADDMLNRLHRSYFDLWAHMPKKPEDVGNSDNINRQWVKQRTDLTGYWHVEDEPSWGYARSRLYVGGYDAYYYAYVFSQVWAFDLFETGFKGHEMDQERGKRYREIVLKPGGSRKPLDILSDFLGREPTVDAFCRALGIAI
jgi:Zn-dependent oligopeptidase